MQEAREKNLPKTRTTKEDPNFCKKQTCFIMMQDAGEVPPLFY